jgi:hypothetical protein
MRKLLRDMPEGLWHMTKPLWHLPEGLWHMTKPLCDLRKPLRLAGTILFQDSHRVNVVGEWDSQTK